MDTWREENFFLCRDDWEFFHHIEWIGGIRKRRKMKDAKDKSREIVYTYSIGEFGFCFYFLIVTLFDMAEGGGC